jgi:hypothetical protein
MRSHKMPYCYVRWSSVVGRAFSQIAFLWGLYLPLHPAQIEEQLHFCACRAILTSEELRRMYSWTAGRIHHMAYVGAAKALVGSKCLRVCITPKFAFTK